MSSYTTEASIRGNSHDFSDSVVLTMYASSPLPPGLRNDTWTAGFILFMLEVVDFICLAMQPFFKWLPLLGLLYVLVPYYNQVRTVRMRSTALVCMNKVRQWTKTP